MDERQPSPRRRRLIQAIGGAAVTAALGPHDGAAALPRPGDEIHVRRIPVSGEAIPAIGLGTWMTFNTAPFTDARAQCIEVLREFFRRGGRMVDSSPMYGLAEATVGDGLEKVGGTPPLFSATKVWIVSKIGGIAQMNTSAKLWGLEAFDLMQVHNMLDWETHLQTLKLWKEQKRIRYIGITTSHGRRHDEMEDVIRHRPEFDFVQFSYNLSQREAEKRLLPAAAENRKAVIVNRPFRTGALFERVQGKSLPPWAAEIGCATWAEYFLKFVISHPAVTCAIPATSRVDHLQENMRALTGPIPDEALRRRMAEHFDRL